MRNGRIDGWLVEQDREVIMMRKDREVMRKVAVELTHGSYADSERPVTSLPTPERVRYWVLSRCGADEEDQSEKEEDQS